MTTNQHALGIAVLALFMSACASSNWTSPHTAGEDIYFAPRALKPAALPDCHTAKLPNGLRLLFCHEDRFPVTGIFAAVRLHGTGPQDRACARLLESAMQNGGATYDAAAIKKHLEHTSSSTGKLTTLSGTMLTWGAFALEQYADESLAMIADVACRPAVTEEALGQAKTRLKADAEKWSKDPPAVVKDLARAWLQPGAAGIEAMPAPEAVGDITVDDLRRWHTREVRPDNMVIGVYGRFDEDAVTAAANRYFGEWQTAGSGDMVPDANDLHGKPFSPMGDAILLPISGAETASLLWAAPAPDDTSGELGLARMARFLLNANTKERPFHRQQEPRAERRFGDAPVESRLLSGGGENLHALELSLKPEEIGATMDQWQAALDQLAEYRVSDSEWDRARYTEIRDVRALGFLYAIAPRLLSRCVVFELNGVPRPAYTQWQETMWDSSPEVLRDYCANHLVATPDNGPSYFRGGMWFIAGNLTGVADALKARGMSVIEADLSLHAK